MQAVAENEFINDYKTYPFDPRISYPSYKSFDDQIDLAKLKSLDADLTEKLTERILADRDDYFCNLYRLEKDTPYQPGVREIWLSRTKSGLPFAYTDRVDDTDIWEASPGAAEFPQLMDFIDTLPFDRRGRMLIIYDSGNREVPAHRDHLEPDVCNEFIWFRTNLKKPFYVLDTLSGRKEYVTSYSAWFDTVNQYHGCDPCEGLSFSIRVDGVFTADFKQRIPRPSINIASTPSLWACLGGHGNE